jgi:hypothetical protein
MRLIQSSDLVHPSAETLASLAETSVVLSEEGQVLGRLVPLEADESPSELVGSVDVVDWLRDTVGPRYARALSEPGAGSSTDDVRARLLSRSSNV